MRICNLVLPEAVGSSPLIEWFEQNTTDPKGSLNPRNVISLLRLARQYQLDVYDRDDPDYDRALPIITAQAMERGFFELSEARLQDTVLAEFQSLRPIIERLKNKEANLNRLDMAKLLRCNVDSPEYARTIKVLCEAGVISKVRSGGVVIARLYRPALNMTRHQSKIVSADRADLREVVDSAMRELVGSEVVLPPMGRNERIFVHGYVARLYPGCSTESIGTDRSDVKRIVITRRSIEPTNGDIVSEPRKGKRTRRGRRGGG
jgi:hypothetical protein